jgi:hypothetical protein
MGKLKIGAALAVLGLLAWAVILHPWGLLYSVGVHPYPASSSTPWTYQLWSGFIPALAIVSIFGGLASHLRSMNCHVTGCWRIGKYPLADGQFKVCRKHSPHPDKLTHAYILGEHARCAAPPSSSPSA